MLRRSNLYTYIKAKFFFFFWNNFTNRKVKLHLGYQPVEDVASRSLICFVNMLSIPYLSFSKNLTHWWTMLPSSSNGKKPSDNNNFWSRLYSGLKIPDFTSYRQHPRVSRMLEIGVIISTATPRKDTFWPIPEDHLTRPPEIWPLAILWGRS